MPERTASTFHVLGIPLTLQADLDATLGQASPRTMAPVPAERGGRVPQLALASSGAQTAGTILQATCTRGGRVGEAGGTWRRSTDAIDEERGLDHPGVCTGVYPVAWSSAVAQRTPCPVVLPDGTHLLAFARRTLVTLEWRIVVERWDPTTETFSATILRSELDSGQEPWPWLLPMPDGRVFCFYWVSDAAEALANIDVDVSLDGGTTWTRHAEYTLQTELVDTTTATLGRITVAAEGGQMVCQFHTTDTTTGEEIWQWLSADDGASFAYLGRIDDCAWPVLRNVNGVIWMVYLFWTVAGSAKVYAQKVTPGTLFATSDGEDLSQFSGLDVGAVALSGGVLLIAGGDVAVAVEDRYLWVFALHISGTTRGGIAVRFDSTTGTADAARYYSYWWNDGQATATEYPIRFQACFYRRQVWLYGQFESAATTYENQIVRLELGGWSSWNMPYTSIIRQDANRNGFAVHWLPTNTPTNYGYTFTGAGTQSIATTPGWYRLTTTANTAYNSLARSCAGDEGLLWVFRLRSVSGGSVSSTAIGVTMEVATALVRYQAALHVSATQVRIRDVHGAVDRGTVGIDTTAGIDVVIAVNHGKVTAMVRLVGDQHDRLWTPIAEGETLTDGGAGGADLVTWGNISSATATSEWQIAEGLDGVFLGDVGALFADGPANPTDLRPGPYLPSSAWLGEGVSLGAQGGPAAGGDSWLLYPDARYALRFASVRGETTQLPHLRGGTRPGPSSGWRALDTADLSFPAFARWDFTDHEDRRFPDIIAIQFVGLNTASVVVRKHVEGGASVTLGTHDQTVATKGLAFERTGAILVCDTSTASTTEPWLQPDQLAGGYVIENGAAYPILHNGPGRWSNDGDAQVPWIEVGGDYASIAAAGTIDVIPPESTFVYFNTTGEGGAGFELYYSSAPVTYEGYIKADVVAVCAGEALEYGPGWGDVRDEEPVAANRRSGYGVDFPRKNRTYRRIWKLPFTWRCTDLRLRGSSAAGARIYFRATSTADAPIVATSGDVQQKLIGIWRQCGGGSIPLLWLPRVVRGTPNVTSYTLASVGRFGLLNNTPTVTRASGRETAGIRSEDLEGTDWMIEELR